MTKKGQRTVTRAPQSGVSELREFVEQRTRLQNKLKAILPFERCLPARAENMPRTFHPCPARLDIRAPPNFPPAAARPNAATLCSCSGPNNFDTVSRRADRENQIENPPENRRAKMSPAPSSVFPGALCRG